MASKPLSNGDAYSDRANSKGWTDQKEKLEKGLVVGKDLAFYTGELKRMGYQITSTNDKSKNYVEVEIVKGPAGADNGRAPGPTSFMPL